MSNEAFEFESISLAQRVHPNCVVCGRKNPRGFHMRFIQAADGSVVSRFDCSNSLEGYPKRLHGGVIASLLDGAMTHCLFMHGYTAVTAELNVRYRQSVETGSTAVIRAWIERNSRRLHLLKAEVMQGGEVRVSASAKFMNQMERMEEKA